MKKALILGAGLVANPMVQYLLSRGYYVSLADRDFERASDMINSHPNGNPVKWDSSQEETLDELLQSHDICVSLLPWTFHLMVARKCIKARVNMITTSYVREDMQELNDEAVAAGIVILNELGLDPGIDHMSAMRIIDGVRARGGYIEEFFSLCGALPAPEAAGNPFSYKFSWSPKGVVLAGNNHGRYLYLGSETITPTEDLFKDTFFVDFPGVGRLEVYPNRDSIQYVDIYATKKARTVFRGTFRYPGWCDCMDAMKACNLTSCDSFDFSGLTYAGFVAKMIGSSGKNIIEEVALHLNKAIDSPPVLAMEWLGLFSDEQMGRDTDSPFEITSDLMIEKMTLGSDERDMIVMQHCLLASYQDNKKEVIRSCMLDFGDKDGDTSVSRTVALPAAIGVEMVLEGRINLKGVYRPILPEIYNPILDRLEDLNIVMKEEYGLPVTEIIRK